MNRFLKYLLSFFKNDWGFQDYPLKTWINSNALQDEKKYGAGFKGWMGLVGRGKNTQEAILHLKENFENYKSNNSSIPRPGTYKEIEFAAHDEVERYEEIAVPFFRDILEMNYYECFISNKSSVLDFPISEQELKEKLKQHYDIEMKIKDGMFVDIFREIGTKNYQ